jgi:hypothetical protein
MNFNQRDLVYVTLELPTGEIQRHPYLIISCRAANEKENYYTGVMMTTTTHRDNYSLTVDDKMFERPLGKHNCQLRLYILVSFSESRIESLINKMKKVDFKGVIQQIKDYVLVVDNTP